MKQSVWLVLAFAAILLSGCSGGSDSTGPQYENPGVYNDKTETAITEIDLIADTSLRFSPNRNVMVYLEDADLVVDEGDPIADGSTDTGEFRGNDNIPMFIDTIGEYRICYIPQPDIQEAVWVTLADLSGQIFFTSNSESCVDVSLPSGEYLIQLSRNQDNLGGIEMPFFLTMEGNTIAIKYNDCAYCDLEGIDFHGRKLLKTNLAGANLAGSSFNNATLEHVDLTGANIDDITVDDATAIDITPPPESNFFLPLLGTLPFLSDFFLDKGKSMYVNYLGITSSKVAGIAIKHTYPIVIDSNDNKHSWGALGGDSGGEYLLRTQANGDIDVETVSFIMTEEPCAWPKDPYYAVVGVCWNLTNRGLYYTGKTVWMIPYYTVILGVFGTYGLDDNSSCARKICREGRTEYSWTKCLRAVKAGHHWTGKDFGVKSDNGFENNPEVELFEQYYGDNAVRYRSAETSDEDLKLEYLQALIKLSLARNVGDLDDATINAILEAHAGMLENLNTVSTDNQELYLREFNRISNETLDEYRAILGMDNFLKFMNIDEDNAFDINAYR